VLFDQIGEYIVDWPGYLELLPCWGIMVNGFDIGGAVLDAVNSIGEDQGAMK
jgi:hypothetical protein